MEDNSNSYSRKRVRDNSEELEVDSSEVKRIRENLLDILVDDTDSNLNDRDADTLDLDSVMRSFEEEISDRVPHPSLPSALLTSDSGDSQPDLGYLLEASDDELGLPPTASSSGEEENNEEVCLSSLTSDPPVGLSDIWRFDDEIQSYDAFAFGIGDDNNGNGNGEYIVFDGLFDYSDVGFVPSDLSELSWRAESLPAL